MTTLAQKGYEILENVNGGLFYRMEHGFDAGAKVKDMPGSEKGQRTPQPQMLSRNKEQAIQVNENKRPDTTTREADGNIARTGTKGAEPVKPAENAPGTDRGISGGRKQSVLNALRQRQTRMKAQEQEKQGQQAQAKKKGEQGS